MKAPRATVPSRKISYAAETASGVMLINAICPFPHKFFSGNTRLKKCNRFASHILP
jgi:hypothetical protein